MDKKQLKKEYKKISRSQKTRAYTYNTVGLIAALIGAAIVIPLVVLTAMDAIAFYDYIAIMITGFAVTVFGLVFSIMAEVHFAKEFKEYRESKEK